MIKIYNFKTGKLREVILEPGERHYLCGENLKRIAPEVHAECKLAGAKRYKERNEQKENQKGT